MASDAANLLPATGFARLPQIIGNPDAIPPILPVFPVGRSKWWEGIRQGIYPRPVKLSPRVTAWRWEDIRRLLEGERNFGSAPVDPRPENPKLVEARRKFWSDVRAGKRPHPRTKGRVARDAKAAA